MEAPEVSQNVGVVVVRGRIAGTHCHGVFQQRRRLLRAACLRLDRSEEHTSELQSQSNLVCRLLLEKKKTPSCTARDLEYTCLSIMRVKNSCSQHVRTMQKH